MQVIDSLDAIPTGQFSEGTAVAIGKFDGVHLGHRALLRRIGEVGAERGLARLVFTFANHPLSYLWPDACPVPLMSREQRIEALSDAGVDACVMVSFDARFASMTAESFVADVLVGQLNAKHVCVGRDFRFGRDGVGDVRLLESMGSALGFDVEIIDAVEAGGSGRVSSSRIREAVLAGDVSAARRMAGNPIAVRGTVVHGDARGRDLGFPTANLAGAADADDPLEGLVPAQGVYAGWVSVDGVRHGAAISVGVNLTFDPDGEPRVEAYLLDFTGDLYGRSIEVQFVERIRAMVAFPNVDELQQRMAEDVRETRRILRDDESALE